MPNRWSINWQGKFYIASLSEGAAPYLLCYEPAAETVVLARVALSQSGKHDPSKGWAKQTHRRVVEEIHIPLRYWQTHKEKVA